MPLSKLEVSDICRAIWNVEQRYRLLERVVDGIPIWQFCRVSLYYELAQKAGVFEDPHPHYRDTLGNKIRRYARALLISNPFLDFSSSDVLVVDHIRKARVDSEYVDIYTYHLIDELKRQSVSHTIYEWPEFNRHVTKAAKNRKHLDAFHLFFERYGTLIRTRITPEERQLITAVERQLKNELAVTIDLESMMRARMRSFKAKCWLFGKLIALKKPKRIYVVAAYGLGYLIMAARKVGVEVVELQHGTFSEYHLGYSFPNGEKGLQLWPDQFWIWADYWKSMCQLPFEDDSVKVYPFEHMRRELSKFRNVARKPRQILVISQGALGERIAAEILRYSKVLEPFHIVYKLHPSEFMIWRSYPSLVILSELPNVSILDGTETPLYRLLAQSPIVIGVFSTVIYEALEFNCTIYLLRLPGIEYMRRLLEMGRAKYLDDLVCHIES